MKVCLLKSDLRELTHDDIEQVTAAVHDQRDIRSPTVDSASFTIAELQRRFRNMMWFCGVSDLKHRDILIDFVNRFEGRLRCFPARYFREGYRPVPKGVSSFLFLTRALEPSRTDEAFLQFDANGEGARQIRAGSRMGVEYVVERSALARSIRTGIGIPTLRIEGKWDYAAKQPYEELRRVVRASGFTTPRGFSWSAFWENVAREFAAVETRLVVVHRINPFSPSTYLTAFVSETPLSPSNVLNVVLEPDLARAKAVCVLVNSSLFLTQFFLLKEETTGRYINIRFYDLEEMTLYPTDADVPALAAVFDRFADRPFPALRDQLDTSFDQRYAAYWNLRRRGQPPLFNFAEEPVDCSPVRMEFDKAVCEALRVPVTDEDLREVYGVLVKEMIVTRGLQRD